MIMNKLACLTAVVCLMCSPSPILGASTSTALLGYLFPAGYTYTSGFTTGALPSLPGGVSKTSLSDSSLNVIKVASGLTHNIVQQNGKTAWEASYPKGSYNPSADPRGGFGFYLGGTNAFLSTVKKSGTKHVMFSYSVMFQNGFNWVLGGKLPGGYGGNGDSAYACTGGRKEDRDQCFDLRLMWRSAGQGELYSYLPLTSTNNATLLSVPPKSYTNPDYGISVGRGSFTFPAGQWVTVAQRIKLNDVGKTNGEIQVFFNGQSAMNIKGLEIRNSSSSLIQGMHFQTFFGGSTPDWATPINQKAWFADVSGAVIPT